MKKVFTIALCLFLVFTLSSCITFPTDKDSKKEEIELLKKEIKSLKQVKEEVKIIRSHNTIGVKIQNSDMMDEIKVLKEIYGKPVVSTVSFRDEKDNVQKIRCLKFEDKDGNVTRVYIINDKANIIFPD